MLKIKKNGNEEEKMMTILCIPESISIPSSGSTFLWRQLDFVFVTFTLDWKTIKKIYVMIIKDLRSLPTRVDLNTIFHFNFLGDDGPAF